MKKRSLGMMLLLTIITFGIYLLVWSCSTQNRVKKKTGLGVGGGLHLLLMFITFGIYSIIWHWKMGGRMVKLGGSNNAVLYLLLGIFTGGFISAIVIQNDINNLPEYSIEA